MFFVLCPQAAAFAAFGTGYHRLASAPPNVPKAATDSARALVERVTLFRITFRVDCKCVEFVFSRCLLQPSLARRAPSPSVHPGYEAGGRHACWSHGVHGH